MTAAPVSRRELIRNLSPAIEEFSFRANQGPEVDWTFGGLAEVIRLRLVAEGNDPSYRVLYCHGLLRDGQPCRVRLPFECLSMPRNRMRQHLATAAVKAGLLSGNTEVFYSLFRALSTLE